MSEYDDLTAEMKSRVVLPQHVYPALSIGKSTHSGELQASVRLYQSKKDVHHVPYSSAVFTSLAVGIPMFAGQLPACSIVTYRVSAPQCLVITWSDYLVELRSEFAEWSMGGGSVWSDRIRANDAGRGGWRDQWSQGSTHGVRAVQSTQGHPTTRRHTLDLNQRQNPNAVRAEPEPATERLAVAGECSGPPSPSLPYQEMALVHQNQNQNPPATTSMFIL